MGTGEGKGAKIKKWKGMGGEKERIKLPAACLRAEPWRLLPEAAKNHTTEKWGWGGSLSLALSAILLFYSSISQNIFLALLECPGTSGIIVMVPDLRKLKFLWERHAGNC